MHRFFLPPAECQGPSITLDEPESRHAAQVLRVRPGDDVTVLDGAGAVLRCEVSSVAKRSVILAVTAREFVSRPPHQVTLLQAIPKGKLLESIIQKATELGTCRIVPLLSERVSAHLDGERSGDKLEKWRRVAIEAIKQSGSAWLPTIAAPATPADALDRAEKTDLSLIASLQPGSRHARGYFQEFAATHGRRPESIAVWVGPEGDFTPEEVRSIIQSGARPITLGRQILRCETAATFCLSVVNYELESPGP